MHHHLIVNTKKSIMYMADLKFRDRTYRDFLNEINEAEKHPYESLFINDRTFPSFYKDKNNILQSPQKDFFAFYALRNIVRGSLVSCRFIEGGNLLHSSGFYALSTISYYSAAFQILITFLALNGSVIISSPIEALLPNQNIPDQILAKLCYNNTWAFEKIKREHKPIWECLWTVLNEQYKDDEIPAFFNDFFSYIAVLNKIPLDLNNKETLKQIIGAIPAVRHQALYTGFGFDKEAYENAINRKSDHNAKIDGLSKSFQHFVLEFLSYCLKETLLIQATVESIDSFSSHLYVLRAGIWEPPFEATINLNLGADSIEKDIENLQKWLHLQ